MPLEIPKELDREIFDVIWCPYCGHREFRGSFTNSYFIGDLLPRIKVLQI